MTLRKLNPRIAEKHNSSVLFSVDVERLMRERYGITTYVIDGDEFRCPCPLPFNMHKHGDRNPSFSINMESRLVNCYVCGGGSIGWLIRNMEPLGDDGEPLSDEQVAEIAHEFSDEFDPEREIERAYQHSRQKPWSRRVEASSVYDRDILRWAGIKTDYWESRGLNVETVEAWKLGYAPCDDQTEKARGRAMVPHRFDGVYVGWTGRATLPEQTPKWRHSDMFPKDTTLFNYDQASKYAQVIVVEAPISAIWLWQVGIPNVVATFGASVTENQIRLLRRFNEVIVWMDADIAGWHGTLEVIDGLSGHCTAWAVNCWSGDPAEKTATECWNVLYERGLIPAFMFDTVLKGNIDKESYDAVHKVRKP